MFTLIQVKMCVSNSVYMQSCIDAHHTYIDAHMHAQMCTPIVLYTTVCYAIYREHVYVHSAEDNNWPDMKAYMCRHSDILCI